MFVVSNSRPFNLVMIWVMVKLKITVMKSEKLFNLRQNPKRMYYTISSKADEFALSVQNWNSGWKKIVHKCKQAIISKKQKQKQKNDGNKKVPIRPLVWKVVQRLIWYGKESFKLMNILLLPFPNHNFLSKFYLMKICGRTAHCKQ